MAGAGFDTAEGILKEFMLPGVQEELNNSNNLLAQIDRNESQVVGETIVASHHIGRNSGVGARKEKETLPTPGAQTYKKSDYTLKQNYGTIRVSTRLIELAVTDRGAFTNAVAAEVAGIRDDLKRYVNFQAYNTSDGVVVGFKTKASNNVLDLNTPVDRRVYNYIGVGMVIDIGTVANPTLKASARTITAIDRTNNTITIDGAAVATATTDRMFRQGAGGAGDDQREITGLQTIINNTGTYAGIDSAVVTEWQSYVADISGPMTEGALETAMDEVGQNGEDVPDLVVTTYAIRKSFADSLKEDRRFNVTTAAVDLKAGYKGLSVTTPEGEVTVTADRDAPAGIVWGINTDDLVQWQSRDWHWLDYDTGRMFGRVPGMAAYDATLEKLHELGAQSRNSHFRLNNVTAP